MSAHDIPLRGWVAIGLTSLATLYGAVLFAWVGVASQYQPEAVLIFVQPLLFSTLLWPLLHRRCTTGDRLAGVAASSIAVFYLLYSFLGGFTVAAGGLPAALLLCAAVWFTPAGTRPTPRPG